MDNFFTYNLHSLRKKKKLSLDELSSKIGISKSTLNNYENGKNEPTVSILITICNFYNVSVCDMLFSNLDNSHALVVDNSAIVTSLMLQIQLLQEKLDKIKGIVN